MNIQKCIPISLTSYSSINFSNTAGLQHVPLNRISHILNEVFVPPDRKGAVLYPILT